jgi:hypothetical protein
MTSNPARWARVHITGDRNPPLPSSYRPDKPLRYPRLGLFARFRAVPPLRVQGEG